MTREQWLYRFSIILENKMRERGVSVRELSNMTGIEDKSIYGYIDGLHVPNAYHVSRIADCLACSTEELIGFTHLYSVDDY